MDPIARSAAQRAARNTASSRLPSPAAEEEGLEEREASVVIVVPNDFIVSPQRPSTPRAVPKVSFFFLLISKFDNILGYRFFQVLVVRRLVFLPPQYCLFAPDER